MITDKQIEKAAIACADEYYAIDLGKDREETNRELFTRGAHGAIEQFLKDLWHDAKEEPINGDILVESTYTSDGFSQKCYSVEYIADIDITYYDWKEYVEQNCVTRWLYIEDLLPKKGGSDGKT